MSIRLIIKVAKLQLCFPDPHQNVAMIGIATALTQRLRSPLFQRGGLTNHDRVLIRRIRESQHALTSATDRELETGILQLRERVRFGTAPTDDKVLVPGAALVCEAVRRIRGFNLYDVQLLAGIALSRGAVAEMATGEGKTLTASVPAVLHALAGRGVHVATSNAYLAERDCVELSPVYDLLGLRAALLPEQAPPTEKREAYLADITYGTGHEFGFDYLRDEVAQQALRRLPLGATVQQRLRGNNASGQKMQRGLPFAIVDEVDNVLLDDAVSPLLLSEGGDAEASDRSAHLAARVFAQILLSGVHYRCDAAVGSLLLTQEGKELVHSDLDASLVTQLMRPWSQYIEQALRVEYMMRRDVHYVIDEGEVRIVDESTGRIFADRSWRDGLHQAVEAKEGVRITSEKQPLARITRQRFYRLYGETNPTTGTRPGLCGMTGTAAGSEAEFADIYGMPVAQIPLRRPSQREELTTRSFINSDAKWDAVALDIQARYDIGQPVLAGTSSIRDSEALASRLDELSIPYQLLNGRQDAEEAQIIGQAGQVGTITIATNLAGRGTDIRPSKDALSCGGLHVIASERHNSARVDRQLVGRSARQGEPGSAQVFVAATDPVIRLHAEWLARSMSRSANSEGECRIHPDRSLQRVQTTLEQAAAKRRRQMLRIDEERDQIMQKMRT